MNKYKPLGRVMSDKEFILKLEKREQRFFALGDFLLEKKYLGQNYYSNLESEAHALETFLDNHKARGNKIFAYFTELVACIRWIANVAHTLKHTQNRYKSYGFGEEDSFFVKIQNFVEFCNSSLFNLYKALKEETLLLGMKISSRPMEEEEFLETEIQEYLLEDLDEKSYCCFDEGEKIIEITFVYAELANKLAELLTDDEPTEDKIEELTSSLHRIQSKYDSYISGSEEEKKDKRLKILRGYISICLHLLEVALYMFHFYERHIKAEGLSQIKKKISEIVDSSQINKNTGVMLKQANDYALKGSLLARDLLKDYADITLAREKIIIPKGSILHLRPAAALVEPVMQCTTPILLEIDGKKVRANSVLEIIAVMGEVADKIEKDDVEMVLQGDQKVVKKMKGNFLTKILETKY